MYKYIEQLHPYIIFFVVVNFLCSCNFVVGLNLYHTVYWGVSIQMRKGMGGKNSGLEYIDLVLAAADCTWDHTDYFDGLRVVLLFFHQRELICILWLSYSIYCMPTFIIHSDISLTKTFMCHHKCLHHVSLRAGHHVLFEICCYIWKDLLLSQPANTAKCIQQKYCYLIVRIWKGTI